MDRMCAEDKYAVPPLNAFRVTPDPVLIMTRNLLCAQGGIRYSPATSLRPAECRRVSPGNGLLRCIIPSLFCNTRYRSEKGEKLTAAERYPPSFFHHVPIHRTYSSTVAVGECMKCLLSVSTLCFLRIYCTPGGACCAFLGHPSCRLLLPPAQYGG